MSIIVLSKKHKELFELFYKKFLSTSCITTVGHEVADCGEWLHNESLIGAMYKPYSHGLGR